MTRPFAAIERFFERLFERPAARLFHTPVQPIQVQRKLERAMDTGRVFSGDRTYVPVRYRVRLNPEDASAFASHKDILEKEWADALHTRARSRGYRLLARPNVVIEASGRISVADIDVIAEPIDQDQLDALGARPESVGPTGTGIYGAVYIAPPLPPSPPRQMAPPPIPPDYMAPAPIPPIPPGYMAPASIPPSAVAPVPMPPIPSDYMAPVPMPPNPPRYMAPAPIPPSAVAPVPVSASPVAPAWFPPSPVEPDLFDARPPLPDKAEVGPLAGYPSPDPISEISEIAEIAPTLTDPTVAYPVPAAPPPVARIEVRTHGLLRGAYEFRSGTVRVGRASSNEIALVDDRVSRNHGQFSSRQGNLVYADLGSTNGSFVNGTRVREIVLGSGDVVRLGNSTLTIQPHA
jgi:hypothetical protein